MKNNYLVTGLLAASIAVALSGCKSPQQEKVKPKEYAQVPLYMAGQQIPGDSQEKYLSNATVKMYSVGRIVDPATGTMREAGTVYRIEGMPQWNLIPQYDANPESFARKQLQQQYGDGVTGQLYRSMTENENVKKSLVGLKQNISWTEEKYRILGEENNQFKQELKKQSDNTAKLLSSMKKMQRYIEILEQKIKDNNTMTFRRKK